RHDRANRGEGERHEGAPDGHFTIEHVSREHLGRETFLVQFLAQLQLLDIVKKLDNLFVGSVTEGAEERGGEEFPAAFAPIEIDVKQIAGVELHLNPGTAIRNDAKAVEHFAVEMDARLESDARRAMEL